MVQQLKRLKISEDDKSTENDDFSQVVAFRERLRSMTDGHLKVIRSNSSTSVSDESLTPTSGVLTLPEPVQAGNHQFSMGARLLKLEKKKTLRKEACINDVKEKRRKSLFYSNQ